MRVLLLYMFFFVALLALFGCTQQASYAPVPLSWEAGHPERKEWTLACMKHVGDQLERLDKAKDIASFHEKYAGGSKDQKANIWCEFFSALSKYESSWNPKASAVDVGRKDDPGSYSIGLTQISVNDQAWTDPSLKYTYEQLLTPGPNLHLAIRIMARQIDKGGLVVLPNSSKLRYWAVILEGNKYQKIELIRAMVRKLPL